MWLRRREQTARHALNLLDRKLSFLRTEQERLHLIARDTERRWQQAASAADRWGVRAAALTGRDGFNWAAPGLPASARIRWVDVMGVNYPSHVDTTLPDAPPGARSPGSAALDRAVDAYRAAARVAAEHAVAQTACQIIDTEVLAVRMRRIAIGQRWLPQVRRLLAELETRLEENERAETVRWRQLAADPAVDIALAGEDG
jgi:vacuolar-type H+-ATPase subunit D/Vma8